MITTNHTSFFPFVGKNMHRVLKLVEKASGSNAPVVITGETGVGKELVAREIHRLTTGRRGSFVVVNCPTFSEGLVESELFGHERGAFTGAVQMTDGILRRADHGMVLFDEIGEAPPSLQAKLLRFLQDGEIRRVGAHQTTHTDVRVIAATHRNLLKMVQEGTFRQDLYYRFAVIEIHVPPLRERRDEIVPLAEYFMKKYAEEGDVELSEEVKEKLAQLSWPGNVRELENAVRRMLALSEGGKLSAQHMSNDKEMTVSTRVLATLAEVKNAHIKMVLEECGGNQSRAARVLGIGRDTIRGLLDGQE